MAIKDLVAAGHVHLDLRTSGKSHLLRKLAGLAAAAAELDAETIVAALDAREALGSTGVGNGLALPHARLPGLKSPVVVLARLLTPVRFEAIDDRPVDLVALILLPEQPAATVNVLGCVARALRDPAAAERIRAARTAAEMLDALARAA